MARSSPACKKTELSGRLDGREMYSFIPRSSPIFRPICKGERAGVAGSLWIPENEIKGAQDTSFGNLKATRRNKNLKAY